MRLHLPCLPHTETTDSYVWCAYTAKIKKFATMMTRRGYEVILYGGTSNEAECFEHVEVVTEEERDLWFGHYDWNQDVFDGFQIEAPWWKVMNARVIQEIRHRQQPDDLLGIIAGWCQKEIADAFPEMLPIEWGIGYSGVFAEHRVFESYAWAHHLAHPDDIRFFDTVIPNFFDPKDFTPKFSSGSYLLYLGRMTPRKGLAIVEEIAKRSDIPVLTAGQGGERVKGAIHLGVVRGEEKKALLAGARALLAPTTYLEPFGGVAVEAMLSGTPAITTDWGGFTETVHQNVSGLRCRTLHDFLQAVEWAERVDRHRVHRYAQRFTLENVAPMYDRYFQRVQTRHQDGWYA